MSNFVEKFSREIKHFPTNFVRKLRKALPDAMLWRLILKCYTHLRSQSWFMRAPSLPEILADLVREYPLGCGIRLAYISSKTSAELYSALYAVRTVRTDLQIACYGVHLSDTVASTERKKVYRIDAPGNGAGLYLTSRPEILDSDFTAAEGTPERQSASSFYIRDWLRENIAWLAADADVNLLRHIGTQDIVVANDFRGLADEHLAEWCLRNVARLVVPGGILIVDGVDLDLKTRVLASLQFIPVIKRPKKIDQPEVSKADVSNDEIGEAILWQYRDSIVFRSPEGIEGSRGDRANFTIPAWFGLHPPSQRRPASLFQSAIFTRRASTPFAWSSEVVRRRRPGAQTLRNRALHRANGE